MSYATQDTQGRDRSFVCQVRQAVISEALVVVAESSGTTNHAARSLLATAMLRTITDDFLQSWAWAVCSDGTTLPGATDAAVLARVAALWDGFAGGT